MSCARSKLCTYAEFEDQCSLAEEGTCPHTVSILEYRSNPSEPDAAFRAVAGALSSCGEAQGFLNGAVCNKTAVPCFVVSAARRFDDRDARLWELFIRCKLNNGAIPVSPPEVSKPFRPYYNKGGQPRADLESFQFKYAATGTREASAVKFECELMAFSPERTSLKVAGGHIVLAP